MLMSPSGKIYIGQTIRSIQTRLKEHETGQSSKCVAIYNAIQKYGWKNFEKDWYECPDEDLNFDEELLIREMETMAPDGYNLKEGGENGKLSDETRKKISEAHLGHDVSEETRQKIRESLTGKTLTYETKQKMSEAHRGEKNHNFGKTHTDESREKMSEAKRGEKNHNFGKTLSKEHKQKLSEAMIGENHPMFGKTLSKEHKQKLSESMRGDKNNRSKKTYQYDLEGNYIRSFGSCGEAGLCIGKSTSKISMCARGDRKTAHGFIWSYDEIFI